MKRISSRWKRIWRINWLYRMDLGRYGHRSEMDRLKAQVRQEEQQLLRESYLQLKEEGEISHGGLTGRKYTIQLGWTTRRGWRSWGQNTRQNSTNGNEVSVQRESLLLALFAFQSNEELLKVERDKAGKMWAAVVKDMEQLKKKDESQEEGRKVPLCSGNNSSLLTEDTEGPTWLSCSWVSAWVL